MSIFAFGILLANSNGFAGPLPSGFSEGSNSRPSPVAKGKEIDFTVMQGVCTSRTYNDGRGESNCGNMNVQSYIGTKQNARLGQTWLYAFDFMVDPTVNHKGHHQPEAAKYGGGGGVNNSRLELARWQGQAIKNHIYDIEVDTTRGVTFLNRRCIAPGQFGEWHRFEMKVKWTSDATGMIQVTCDGRVVWAKEGVATNQNPRCHVANHCEEGVIKNPKSFYFQFGAFHDPEYVNGQRIWARIPGGSYTMRYRNIDVRRLQGN